jgi:tRNA threonylcarbamoyladenosine biosynthesis protein TsaE
MEKRVANIEELTLLASELVASLTPQAEGATLITLSGELGAGKTAFTKAVAKALGVEEVVNSPTFVLEKIYQLTNQPFKRLVHIDAYRLESGAELAGLGFDELMKDAGNLIMLEWPERVTEILLHPAVQISLVVHEDGSRTLTYV